MYINVILILCNIMAYKRGSFSISARPILFRTRSPWSSKTKLRVYTKRSAERLYETIVGVRNNNNSCLAAETRNYKQNNIVCVRFTSVLTTTHPSPSSAMKILNGRVMVGIVNKTQLSEYYEHDGASSRGQTTVSKRHSTTGKGIQKYKTKQNSMIIVIQWRISEQFFVGGGAKY